MSTTPSEFPLVHNNDAWTLFELSPDALFLCNDQGMVTQINPAAEALLGAAADDLVGQSLRGYWMTDMPPVDTYVDCPERFRESGTGQIRQADGQVCGVEWVAIAHAVAHQHLLILRDRPDLIPSPPQPPASPAPPFQAWEQLVQSSSEGWFVLNRDGQVVFANQTIASWLGGVDGAAWVRSLQGHSLTHWLEICDPNGQPIPLADLPGHQILQGQSPPPRQIQFRRKPRGDWRWASLHAMPLLDAEGQLSWVAVRVQDITPQKHADHALTLSERRYQAVLNTQTEMICRFLPDGTLTYVNQAYCNTFGRTATELIGQNFLHLIPVDDRPIVQQQLAELCSLTPQHPHCFHEHQSLDHQGQVIWQSWSNKGIFDDQGNLKEIQAIGRDITEQKRLERALQESELKFRTLFEILPLGLTITDANGGIVEANPASETILGISTAEHVNRKIDSDQWQLIGTDGNPLNPADYASMQALQENRVVTDVEMGVRLPNGEVRWIDVTAAPLPLEGYGVAIAYIDITHRKQVDQAFRSAQERYLDLLQSVNGIVWEANATNWQQIFVSQQAELLLGYPIARWMDEPHFWLQCIHPDDRPNIVAYYQHQSEQPEHYTLDYRMVAASGQVRWFRDRVMCHTADDGTPLTYRGLMTDITDQKAAEQEQAKLIAILEATPDCVAMIGADGYFSYLNRAGRQILGFGETDPLQQIHFSQVIPTQHQTRLLQDEVPTLHQRGFWVGESVLLGQDGREIPVSMVILVHRDDLDGVDFFSCIARDISDQKRVEASLRLQAEREHVVGMLTQHIRESLELKDILQTTVNEVLQVLQGDRALIFQLHADHHGRIEAEARTAPCQSLEGNVYLSNCLRHCYPAHCSLLTHQTHNACQEPILDCAIACLLGLDAAAQIAVPIVVQGVPWGLLVVHQTYERQWQAWEVELLEAIVPQLSIAIRQAQLYSQLQQFNQRLEAEVQSQTAQLRQALDFDALLKRITDKVRDSLDESQILQTAVEELGQGLGVLCCDTGLYDLDAQTSTIAYEYVTHIPSALNITFQMQDGTHPEVYPQLLAGSPCMFCDAQVRVLRGSTRHFCILACPIRDDQGILGDMWLFKRPDQIFDEMESRLVEQVANQCAIALRQARLYEAAQQQVRELERLNLLKDDFLNTVSHELRTPMSNMKMALQMVTLTLTQMGLLGDRDDPDAVAGDRLTQYCLILESECQRETNLINDLLDLSRLEAEVEPLMIQTIDLESWIRAIAEPFEQRIQSHQQTLTFDLPPDLPRLSTDLGYLERILSELLNNACKYTPAHETISLAVTSAHDGIELRISNSGITIPPTELPHVFDKFYRLPNNDPWKYGGTGLGLALVQRLVERLQGTIQTHSQNNVTTFQIWLPTTLPDSVIGVDSSAS